MVIAGGGTAGHVFPALALASALDRDEVTFLGTRRGVEARLVPAAGFAFEAVEVSGFDRSRPLSLIPVGAKAVAAIGAARRLLARLRPAVVVGMGGYVSLPCVLAARSRRVPVVVHEQNIVLGLANRVARPLAARIGVSFEESLAEAGARAVLVGNPLRPEIAEFDRAATRARGLERFGLEVGRKTVLIFGGSQGARTINEAGVGLASRWSGRGNLQVLHITGAAHRAAISARAAESMGALIYRTTAFVDAMAEAYAVADLAVCRSGATTVAELTAVGLPAILVPYPHHRDRQQERHAGVLEKSGAAACLDDREATSENVARMIDELLDPHRLAAMSAAALELGRPRAAQSLAELVRAVA